MDARCQLDDPVYDLNDLDQLDANMDHLLQDLLVAENGLTVEETYL